MRCVMETAAATNSSVEFLEEDAGGGGGGGGGKKGGGGAAPKPVRGPVGQFMARCMCNMPGCARIRVPNCLRRTAVAACAHATCVVTPK